MLPKPEWTKRSASVELGIFSAYLLITLGLTALVLGGLHLLDGRTDVVALLFGNLTWAGMVLPFLVYLLRRRNETLESIGLVLPRRTWRRELLIGAGLGVGMKIALIPLALVAVFFGMQPGRSLLSIDGLVEMAAAMTAGSVAGALEEIVFRGYLRRIVACALGDAKREGSLWPTGAAISLVFGLVHFTQGALAVVLISFVGMMLFFIVCSKRFTLVHCIVAHAVFNATSFLSMAS